MLERGRRAGPAREVLEKPARGHAPALAERLVAPRECALGPLLGGLILRLLPDELGTFLGQTIRDYHVLILGSMVGCLLSTHLLDFVREEEAHPSEAVWRTMRRMQPFNPMLTLGSAAQMVLTPGGLLGLTQRSLRLMRQQVKALGEVGGELVEGTTDAIRAKLPGDEPDAGTSEKRER